jgi:hypothetical protein
MSAFGPVALPRIFCAKETLDIVRTASTSADVARVGIKPLLTLLDFKLLGRNSTTLIWPLLEHTRHNGKAQDRSDLLCLVYRFLDLLLMELFLRSFQRDQFDR